MEHEQARLQAILLEHIDINPAFEVRMHWSPEGDPDLPDLAASLSGMEGQISPIIVAMLTEGTSFGRRYTLIAGRRRLEAARLQKRRTIEARILPPARLDDPVARLRLFAIAVAENVHRKNLTPEERREALRRLKLHYEEVYPPQRKTPALPTTPSSPPPYPSFTTWAAAQFHISRRAVSKDLRLAQLAQEGHPTAAANETTRGPSGRPSPPSRGLQPTPITSTAPENLVSHFQHVTTALQTLKALLTQRPRPPLPATEFQHLQHVLEETLAFLRYPEGVETLDAPPMAQQV